MTELTDEQKNICHCLRLAIIRSVLNTSDNQIWHMIKDEMEKAKNENDV